MRWARRHQSRSAQSTEDENKKNSRVIARGLDDDDDFKEKFLFTPTESKLTASLPFRVKLSVKQPRSISE
jgi:hypothetical protein